MSHNPTIKEPNSPEHLKFLKIKEEYNLEDFDFYINPLPRGCYPTRRFVIEHYLEKNLTLEYMCIILNVAEGKFLNILKLLDIRKPLDLVQESKLRGFKKIDYKKRTERTIQTNLERYGVENISQIEDVKLKKELKSIEKFGTKCVFQAEEVKDKIKQTNLEKYGAENNAQRYIKNLENLNAEYFKTFINKEGFFDYLSCMEYYNFKTITTVMKYKNIFKITNLNEKLISKVQAFLYNKIKCEEKFFNKRGVIDKYELDIYIPSIKLGIEYNGLMFHSQGITDVARFKDMHPRYHLNKTNECESKGIQLFHIFEGEPLDLWLSLIHNKLGLNTRIFARKCWIREVSSSECKEFLEENHLQGSINSKINIGLFTTLENIETSENSAYADITEVTKDTETLVAVMTFSKPRFNKNYEYELIRFCNLKDCNVVGGASKLFKYFLMKYKPKSIISYANRRFSNGDLYYKLGFKLKSISEPNYFYFRKEDLKLESRNKYQKHKLKDILDIYDENLSETQNMYNNGYRKIYDCGNLVFEWRKN